MDFSYRQKIYTQLRDFGLDPRDWLLKRPTHTNKSQRPVSLELIHRQENNFKLLGWLTADDLLTLELK